MNIQTLSPAARAAMATLAAGTYDIIDRSLPGMERVAAGYDIADYLLQIEPDQAVL